jgi:hypothetical protein
MIGSNIVCRDCGGDVKLTEATTGIATQIKLICKSFLDLPRNSTYQRHTFAKVLLAIRPEIKKKSQTKSCRRIRHGLEQKVQWNQI